MEKDKFEKNSGNEIIMEQPDMIYHIKSYHSMKVNDGMVSQIYSFRMDQENDCIVTSIPDASIDFVMFKNTETDECGIELIGPTKQRTSSYVRFQRNTEYFGVRFHPCYPMEFLNSNSAEMYDRVIMMDPGQDSDYVILKQLDYEGPLSDKLNAVQSAFHHYVTVRNDPKSELVKYILSYISSHMDGFQVKSLSEYIGYTPYYLNKVFKAYTGYTIGRYHNLLKVHSVLNMYNYLYERKLRPDQARIAVEKGYSDQAHMIREFKKEIGSTPAKYWKKISANIG